MRLALDTRTPLVQRLPDLEPTSLRALGRKHVCVRQRFLAELLGLSYERRRPHSLDREADSFDREFLVRAVDSRFPRENQYVFRHALLRDSVYAMLTEQDRTVAHRLAAEWLVGVGEKNASILAHHFELAKEADSAAEYRVRAGDQATRL